jgi:DNA-binding NtrC family response regulator
MRGKQVLPSQSSCQKLQEEGNDVKMTTTQNNGRILIVDDEEKIRKVLGLILSDAGHTVELAKDGSEAIEKAKMIKPHVVIADLQMPRMDGVETILNIKESDPRVIGIIITAHGTISSAVQAMKQGIYDYITKPFDNDQLVVTIDRALEFSLLKEELENLRRGLGSGAGIDAIIGEAEIMQELRRQILKIAQTDATVLIEGESGTGKELTARAIHFESTRKRGPVVVLDCTAIPPNLMESEFFGHEKGTFTDAKERHTGKFEEANNGTIFLDEISELKPDAQIKLLRVLQEKEFTRLGSTKPTKVDVRIVAASNKNLEALVKAGMFREDLFYRLNVLRIRVPSLREHLEDIPLYVNHFLRKYQGTFGKSVQDVSPDALHVLQSRSWNGNIRELENTIQRTLLNMRGNILESADLDFLTHKDNLLPPFDPSDGLESFVKATVEESERLIILNTLKSVGWNRTEAARNLKISRKTLFNKIKQYKLDTPETGPDDIANNN